MLERGLFRATLKATLRVANSHAYGVILTHLTSYSRTHAIDKFTRAFKIYHTHSRNFKKSKIIYQFFIIVTYIVYFVLAAESYNIRFFLIFPCWRK